MIFIVDFFEWAAKFVAKYARNKKINNKIMEYGLKLLEKE